KDVPETSQIKFGELTVHVTNQDQLGAVLLFATGSERHLHQLQTLAKKKAWTLDARGLHRNGKVIAGGTEEEIYDALGLSFIEPELREGRGEIALARKHRLPR